LTPTLWLLLAAATISSLWSIVPERAKSVRYAETYLAKAREFVVGAIAFELR